MHKAEHVLALNPFSLTSCQAMTLLSVSSLSLSHSACALSVNTASPIYACVLCFDIPLLVPAAQFLIFMVHSSFSHFLYASLLHAQHLSIRTFPKRNGKRADDGSRWKKKHAHKFVIFCVIIFVTAQLVYARFIA